MLGNQRTIYLVYQTSAPERFIISLSDVEDTGILAVKGIIDTVLSQPPQVRDLSQA